MRAKLWQLRGPSGDCQLPVWPFLYLTGSEPYLLGVMSSGLEMDTSCPNESFRDFM